MGCRGTATHLVALIGDALAPAECTPAKHALDPQIDVGRARAKRRVLRVVAEDQGSVDGVAMRCSAAKRSAMQNNRPGAPVSLMGFGRRQRKIPVRSDIGTPWIDVQCQRMAFREGLKLRRRRRRR